MICIAIKNVVKLEIMDLCHKIMIMFVFKNVIAISIWQKIMNLNAVEIALAKKMKNKHKFIMTKLILVFYVQNNVQML